jgi:hypothetical protein
MHAQVYCHLPGWPLGPGVPGGPGGPSSPGVPGGPAGPGAPASPGEPGAPVHGRSYARQLNTWFTGSTVGWFAWFACGSIGAWLTRCAWRASKSGFARSAVLAGFSWWTRWCTIAGWTDLAGWAGRAWRALRTRRYSRHCNMAK